jgi:hypothetical protein
VWVHGTRGYKRHTGPRPPPRRAPRRRRRGAGSVARAAPAARRQRACGTKAPAVAAKTYMLRTHAGVHARTLSLARVTAREGSRTCAASCVGCHMMSSSAQPPAWPPCAAMAARLRRAARGARQCGATAATTLVAQCTARPRRDRPRARRRRAGRDGAGAGVTAAVGDAARGGGGRGGRSRRARPL